MISVAIIAKDEQRHIGAAIDSVAGLADEVLVLLDDRTRDATSTICRARGARVVTEPWRGFGPQRNRALDLCQGEWLLFLDADERVTPELRDEIARIAHCTLHIDEPECAMCNMQSPVGYWIPRSNIFFGRALRGGGWYPDHQLRLLRRTRARYADDRLVHERADLDGEAGQLTQHIVHLNIERLGELWSKQTSYAIQEAQTLFLAGRRARARNFLGAPLREFRRRYLQLGGWRDGPIGLLMCGTLAYFELIKFAHLKGLERR